ncbi:MAG TPA: lysozyme inhibitor LprI family protein [Bauldia sp.]|nr:lysozyme inhibitor LprI family protein [Bauldia sp.]
MRLTAAAFMLAAVSPAIAQDVPGCGNATSNIEIGNCTYAAYQAADKELNDIWPKVLAYIDSQTDYMPADALQKWKATIVAAQKAWVTFKESDCGAVQYEWWGGSGAGIAETSCLYAHTAQRVEDLKERYLDR